MIFKLMIYCYSDRLSVYNVANRIVYRKYTIEAKRYSQLIAKSYCFISNGENILKR